MKKKFDCVEMKNDIQAELQKEYKERKEEFKSYADFINVAADNDPLVVKFRKRITQKHPRKKTA